MPPVVAGRPQAEEQTMKSVLRSAIVAGGMLLSTGVHNASAQMGEGIKFTT
jgi:hypothetical protein